jgi:hypothetical protein
LQLKEFQKISTRPSPEGSFWEVGSSGGIPAVENVLQRKSPREVITIDKREVVLPLQRLVKPCRVLYESVGSPTGRKAMTARALALEKQAQKLPATERERLAERLLVQMKHEPLTAVDEAWIAEAEKRFGAWKRKATKTVSAGKALREIRQELRH